jgi:hypothetical protein
MDEMKRGGNSGLRRGKNAHRKIYPTSPSPFHERQNQTSYHQQIDCSPKKYIAVNRKSDPVCHTIDDEPIRGSLRPQTDLLPWGA